MPALPAANLNRETLMPSTPLIAPSREFLRAATRFSEADAVKRLIPLAEKSPEVNERIARRAGDLVQGIRSSQGKIGNLEDFLQTFGLSSKEGIGLMCLAEALLRIPDSETADSLIAEKIGSADWASHLGESETLFVNASTWALMLTGKVLRLDEDAANNPAGFIKHLVNRAGEPVIRAAMKQAMKIMGRQFVMGRSIAEATERAQEYEKRGYRFSYDMLGEAARTDEDAERYFQSYSTAIAAIGAAAHGQGPIRGAGISVKLSALHPRYEEAQSARVRRELGERLVALAELAARENINFCVDAEESERLELSLDLIEHVANTQTLAGWEGFGLAVQVYQKRAPALLDWLAELARGCRRKFMVRLVKGAYWDSEIKRGQERGWPLYPVYTRKSTTDTAWLACAHKLLGHKTWLFPQFATHNAHAVASILETAGTADGYEFQRLHGMGESLYDQIVTPEGPACRVYAPVGGHEDLLAYLVRRLLENGANTSFVNRLSNESVPLAEITADPVAKTKARMTAPQHPKIPLPQDIYGQGRINAAGIDLSDRAIIAPLMGALSPAAMKKTTAVPVIGGKSFGTGPARSLTAPADPVRIIGTTIDATLDQVKAALASALAAQPAWARSPVNRRADALRKAADLMENRMALLMGLIVHEGGRTIGDALAEIREAVDFCRYYAQEAERLMAQPKTLQGPTGELNQLSLHGRGVFACISPWNFPLAIFMGQIVAALVAGNAVLAKPAEQTPLTAAAAITLLHDAGIPGDVLHFLPGDGPTIGSCLLSDDRIGGVAFTGSTATAQIINRTLAARKGPIVPLIAETGGQNAMIVDSSALPEQVTDDVLTSAFRSAGQRCSALRVLYLPDNIADKIIKMLVGATAELVLGLPERLETDIGPVIDDSAKSALLKHIETMKQTAKLHYAGAVPQGLPAGYFVPPHIFEIAHIGVLPGEVFGPILHIVRYKAGQYDEVITQINSTGYGLTLGIHTRIERIARHIASQIHAGNAYVNRSLIGATVGVQPFGGEGLSGTGPKAGGPHYLLRFMAERTLSINTTASGGNVALVSMDDA